MYSFKYYSVQNDKNNSTNITIFYINRCRKYYIDYDYKFTFFNFDFFMCYMNERIFMNIFVNKEHPSIEMWDERTKISIL